MEPRYGFSLLMRGNDSTPDAFVKMAQRAEALELDSLWCSAHIVLPPQTKSGYVMIPGRKHPDHWKERYWEPFTVLSYLAAHTSKIELGTSITVLPMHNPFEIAKQVAEVDQFSNGRFIFGIGVGWFEEEFDVLGQDFHTRGARTNEALELMRALWDPDPVTYEGKYYQVKDACFGPKPVQQPHPPIWIAGSSKGALRRTAKYGDAWHPVRPSYEFFQEAQQELAGYLDEAGRAPDSLGYAVKLPCIFQDSPPSGDQPTTQGRPQDIADALKRYQELGADHFVLDLVPETLQVALDTMERFAQEVRPKL